MASVQNWYRPAQSHVATPGPKSDAGQAARSRHLAQRVEALHQNRLRLCGGGIGLTPLKGRLVASDESDDASNRPAKRQRTEAVPVLGETSGIPDGDDRVGCSVQEASEVSSRNPAVDIHRCIPQDIGRLTRQFAKQTEMIKQCCLRYGIPTEQEDPRFFRVISSNRGVYLPLFERSEPVSLYIEGLDYQFSDCSEKVADLSKRCKVSEDWNPYLLRSYYNLGTSNKEGYFSSDLVPITAMFSDSGAEERTVYFKEIVSSEWKFSLKENSNGSSEIHKSNLGYGRRINSEGILNKLLRQDGVFQDPADPAQLRLRDAGNNVYVFNKK